MARLEDIAPRLARARDQRLAEIRAERTRAVADAFGEMTKQMGELGIQAERAARALAQTVGEAWWRR